MIRTICNSFARSMKRHIKVSYFLIICTFFFTSCATTTITDVWKAQDYKGKAQKIVVLMVAKSPDIRNVFENRFVAELEARGNKAIQSYKIVTMEQLPDREFVKSQIKRTGADTVLISRLIDIKTIEGYVPGQRYIDFMPSSYYGWGSYYTVISADYGYTADIQVSHIETNLYNMETEKLIWSAHSKTERTEGEQQLINTFIKIILQKLSSDKIIQ